MNYGKGNCSSKAGRLRIGEHSAGRMTDGVQEAKASGWVVSQE
jgi:hypothetical protein